MNRNERHAAILRLVGSQPISTQTELADALHR
jgi:arginine repressor